MLSNESYRYKKTYLKIFGAEKRKKINLFFTFNCHQYLLNYQTFDIPGKYRIIAL